VTIEALYKAIGILSKGAEKIKRAVDIEKALLNVEDKKMI
jgi:hypothetical protein